MATGLGEGKLSLNLLNFTWKTDLVSYPAHEGGFSKCINDFYRKRKMCILLC